MVKMCRTLPSPDICKEILTAKEAKEFFEDWFGTKDHPKADKLFTLAWEEGHACGIYEVALYYSDFMELL
jgi:hypothetical protein